jgi:hypothetical protein
MPCDVLEIEREEKFVEFRNVFERPIDVFSASLAHSQWLAGQSPGLARVLASFRGVDRFSGGGRGGQNFWQIPNVNSK